MRQFDRRHYLYDILNARTEWMHEYSSLEYKGLHLRWHFDAYSVGVADAGRPIQAIRYYYAE